MTYNAMSKCKCDNLENGNIVNVDKDGFCVVCGRAMANPAIEKQQPITKEEFDEFRKDLFKHLKETYEPKSKHYPEPRQDTIPKPLEDKIKQWTKPDQDKIINELPL